MKAIALVGFAHLMIALGLLLAGLALVRSFEPPPLAPLAIDALTNADWPRCVIERGPPLPMQKAYQRNPNGGIA